MSITLSSPATGLWQKMGDFLTWISENQAISEEYLRADVEDRDAQHEGDSSGYLGVANAGFLNPWIAEFSQKVWPDPEVLFVALQSNKDIDSDDDLDESPCFHLAAFASKPIAGAISNANAEFSDLRSREDGAFLSLEMLSPLRYWNADLNIEHRTLVTDYRAKTVTEEWKALSQVTVGDLLSSWYDEVTWGGRNPLEREEKLQSLNNTNRWAIANPDKLIDLLNPQTGEVTAKMTPIAFEWLASKEESNN